jgi:hypothetical protein
MIFVLIRENPRLKTGGHTGPPLRVYESPSPGAGPTGRGMPPMINQFAVLIFFLISGNLRNLRINKYFEFV